MKIMETVNFGVYRDSRVLHIFNQNVMISGVKTVKRHALDLKRAH